MDEVEELSSDYATYLERRYCDLKDVLEAVFIYHPLLVTEENHMVEVMSAEMNYLADMLGFEGVEAFWERLCAVDGEDVEGPFFLSGDDE